VWVNDVTRRGAVIYRDSSHIIYRREPFYVIYDLFSRSRRFYTDIRDVVRSLNRNDGPLA
jgi:hypothetical protein